ncbi:MAG: hypothetical protein NT075_36505 [Chloroflexi bacterium]|nr:hypothetical protein [Chloroflexota bacterium]
MLIQRESSYLRMMLLVGLTTGLLTLLLCSMTACQAVAQIPPPPPHRLALLKTPPYGLYPDSIVVAPNGLAYIILLTGQIVVLDGPQMVTVIPKPLPEINNYSLSFLAVQPKTGLVYLTDDPGFVHVISGTRVITSIGDIQWLPNAITANPHSGLVYVANAGNRHNRQNPHPNPKLPGTVDVISGTRVLTELLVGYAPQVLVADPGSAKVYVGQLSGHESMGQKQVGPLGILEDATLITNTFLGPQQWDLDIADIAVNAQDGSLYWIYGGLYYWDGQHPVVQAPLHLLEKYGNGALNHIVVDAKHNLAYASYWGAEGNIVAVVRQDQVLAEIPVGHDPRQMAVDTLRDYIYVANRLDGTMSVIRGTEVITTLDTGGAGAEFIAVDERRGYVYVSNSDSHTIAVFGYDQPVAKPALWQTFLAWLGK